MSGYRSKLNGIRSRHRVGNVLSPAPYSEIVLLDLKSKNSRHITLLARSKEQPPRTTYHSICAYLLLFSLSEASERPSKRRKGDDSDSSNAKSRHSQGPRCQFLAEFSRWPKKYAIDSLGNSYFYSRESARWYHSHRLIQFNV